MNDVERHLATERYKDALADAIQQLVEALRKADNAPSASFGHLDRAEELLRPLHDDDDDSVRATLV